MKSGTHWGNWGTATGIAGVTGVIAVLPWAASDRLPHRLATHWSGTSGRPDGSMPLWAAAVFPALLWLALALVTTVVRHRSGPSAAPVAAITLLTGGVLLMGAQACVVRANLDRADWRRASQPTMWLVALLVTTVAAGVTAWLLTRHRLPTPTASAPPAPALVIPEGQQLAWFSRITNPWLQGMALLTGLIALASGTALAAGLASPAALSSLCAATAPASLALAASASVRAQVSARGLEVAFGPLGWPVRRWTPSAIDSARAEHRTPAHVGGWGYRLTGPGTTVMVRAGDCLVVHPRGRRREFAVSAEDAERGAALLNALRSAQPHRADQR
ncbi:DUF1648 domain-containing protein [Streptomyces sp. NPDC002676]